MSSLRVHIALVAYPVPLGAKSTCSSFAIKFKFDRAVSPHVSPTKSESSSQRFLFQRSRWLDLGSFT